LLSERKGKLTYSNARLFVEFLLSIANEIEQLFK
jgi:hypothetical protein